MENANVDEKDEVKVPGFVRAFEAAEKQLDENKEKIPTTRERLMSRAKTLTVDVPFADETGEFKIKCRVFTQAEQNEALAILSEFERIKADTNSKDKIVEYNAALKRVYALVAYPKGVCLDSEMILEFWEGGQFTSDVPFFILQYVMKEMATAIQNAKSFRPKQ
jgi:hypothetical protein